MKYFTTQSHGVVYGSRIFILQDASPTVIAVLDKHCIWGGHDKTWQESFGTVWGWEFNDQSFNDVIEIFESRGYRRVQQLKDLRR